MLHETPEQSTQVQGDVVWCERHAECDDDGAGDVRSRMEDACVVTPGLEEGV